MKRISAIFLTAVLLIGIMPTNIAFAAYTDNAFVIMADEMFEKGTVIDGAWELGEFEGEYCLSAHGAKTRESTGSPILQYIFADTIDVSEYRFMVIEYYRTGDFNGMSMKLRTQINGGSNLLCSPLNVNNRWHKTMYELRGEEATSEQALWFQYKPFGESATLDSTKDEHFYMKSIGFYKENPFTDEEQAEFDVMNAEFEEKNRIFMGELQEHADFSYLDGYERTGELLTDPSFENFENIEKKKTDFENLINDSGFEGTAPPELYMQVGGEFEQVDGGKSGKCLKIKNRTSNLNSIAYNVKDILEQHGQGIYKMSVNVKCDEGSKSIGNNYYLSAKIKGTMDTSVSWQGLSTKIAASWIHHEVTFVAMWNGDIASAVIYVEGSVKTDLNDFYIDDLELYKISDIVTDIENEAWFGTADSAEITKVSDGAYDGIYCIKVTDRADCSTGIAQNIANALNENGAGLYSVSAYVKTDKKSPSINKPYIIYLKLISDGGTTVEKRVDYYMSDDWQRIYFVFDLQWKGNVTNAMFCVRGYDSKDTADFYIDNCSMFKYIKNDYSEEHTKYMEGYPDGTFKPDASITRAEAVNVVGNLLTDVDALSGFECKYKDVSDDAWYRNSVAVLGRIGVLNVFDGEYFKPDKAITRAELASLVNKINVKSEQANLNTSFTDVGDDYFLADEIRRAASRGIVNGYEDGSFRPDMPVTRAEAVTMINKALSRNTVLSSFYGRKLESFSDVTETHWAYCQITEATNDHKASIYDKGNDNRIESWKIDSLNYDTDLAEKTAAEIEVKGEKLKEEILNAKDEVEITGTKYYVSNNGNDSNSGLSPEEAWATTDKVQSTEFKDGDGVLFERGSTWWGVAMRLESGVTYAAYGEGDKPEFYGTARNYADPSCWKETEIPNVWETVDIISGPAGHILFDEEIYSYKVQSNDELKKNFDFFDVEYNNSPVRLYYDGGNPGNAFEKIYIAPGTSVINAAGKSNIRVDNLAVKYTGWHGFQTSDIHNMTITNCVVGWIGGAGSSSRWGNGIEFWGSASDCTVDHCWVYQTYDTGVTNQFKGVYDQICVEENIKYTNNLLDYCSYSFEFFMYQKNSNNDIMRDVYFENNISRYCGYGWGDNNRPTKNTQRQVKGWAGKNRVENIVIRNNLFGEAKYGTFDYSARPINPNFSVYFVVLPQYGLVIDGNTYVEKDGAAFAEYKGTDYTYGYDLHSDLVRDGVDLNAKIALVENR